MEKSGAEKPLFGEVAQVGIVVKDIDKAVEYYHSIGIGPFAPSGKPPVPEHTIRGETSHAVHKTVFAQMGPVELELLQPLEGGGGSSAREFLERRGEGVQHIAFFVDDLDSALSRVAEMGIEVLQMGRRPGGGGYALLDTDAVGGVIIELVQKR